MRRTRSFGKSGFPGGRRFATALVVSTLAGTGLAACGGDAEDTPQAKAAKQTAEAEQAADKPEITWGTCPEPYSRERAEILV